MNLTDTSCSLTSAEYQYSFLPVVYILALVVGLPGNLAALFVFTFKITPRTAFSVFISNLALADILILCTLPFRIHYHLHRDNWVFGDVACRITGVLFYCNNYMSLCLMACICVDRYMATVHPHAYQRQRRPWRSLAVSVALWCVAGVAMLVFVVLGPLETNINQSGGRSCFENLSKHEWDTRAGMYNLLGLILFSLVPTVIILVCYPLAVKRISMIRTNTAQRALRVIYTILAITLLCFLPNHLVYLLHILQRTGVIKSCTTANRIFEARRVTMALVTLNTCLDPVLYYLTTGHFKWRLLKMTWLCGRVESSRDVSTIAVDREAEPVDI
ncbi:lysophosphatidic acid receptor 6-like [Pleuronectes platessa]|uniref:lysophosphatidic acid receptor 6-like n=1 Tax=Pleuronectes platessa TaxID=8262 RepID=UPI00232A70D0|nr:lysophosphatidic acid receptor 6-like [Pleuronectes platessa]